MNRKPRSEIKDVSKRAQGISREWDRPMGRRWKAWKPGRRVSGMQNILIDEIPRPIETQEGNSNASSLSSWSDVTALELDGFAGVCFHTRQALPLARNLSNGGDTRGRGADAVARAWGIAFDGGEWRSGLFGRRSGGSLGDRRVNPKTICHWCRCLYTG